MRQMKKRYRDPRPGEVPMWLSSHATKIVNMGSITSTGNELRIVPAPCCGRSKEDNPSLQINDTTGMWRCFSCQKVGNWFTLTREFQDPLPMGDRYREDVSQHFNLEQMAKFANPAKPRRPVTGDHYPDLLQYCKNRGVEEETLKAFHVSTQGPKALRWPIYAVHEGQWKMVNARLRVCIDRDKSKVGDWFGVKNGPTNLLIGNHLLNLKAPDKRVIIFEGQWDAMIAYQLGLENSFSIPSGVNNVDCQALLRYIPEDWEVWLGMDMDGPGQTAIEEFFKQLGTDKVARFKLPFKDLNDWYIENPFITKEDVMKTLVGLTSTANLSNKDPAKKYVSIKMGGSAPEKVSKLICELPWPKTSKMLSGGIYEGQTTGILAPSGVGKTTYCNQVVSYAAGKGIKCGIISLEGTRDAFTSKLEFPIRGQWHEKDWDFVLGNLMISQLQGKAVTPQQCHAEAEEMIQDGAKIIVIDNLDYICGDSGNSKLTAYGNLINLAMSAGIHIIVVWQPNKVDRLTVVNSGNQKGYSQFLQDADNYMNLNVIEDFVQIEVEKTREDGVDRVHNKVWMIYDKEIRCFRELEEMPDVQNKTGGLINLSMGEQPW